MWHAYMEQALHAKGAWWQSDHSIAHGPSENLALCKRDFVCIPYFVDT